MSTSEKSVFVVRKETSSSVREGRDLRFLPRKRAARHFRELWTVIIITVIILIRRHAPGDMSQSWQT